MQKILAGIVIHMPIIFLKYMEIFLSPEGQGF